MNKYNEASLNAGNFIEENAQTYLDEYGFPSLDIDEVNGAHSIYAKLTATEIVEKINNSDVNISDALQIIGYLLDHIDAQYRTMDIMGIMQFLTKDKFVENFPEYKVVNNA